MNHTLIGQIAGLISLIQVIPYITSTIQGYTRPERASYFIWTIVNVLAISSYIVSGATTTIWNGVALTITGFIIFLLSIKYGLGGFSKFDSTCLLLALGGAGLWIYTSNSVIALYYLTLVGAIGFLPTIRKVYFLPRTENKLSWSLATFASGMNFFALTSFSRHLLLPLISAFLLQGTVVILILLPQKRFKHSRRQPHLVHLFLSHPVFAK